MKVTVTTLRIVPLLSCMVLSASLRAGEKVVVRTAQELQNIFARPIESTEVHLLPGEYHITPYLEIDSTCGNCENPNTLVPITVGLTITGNNIHIIGPEDRSAVVYTHAGYGLFFGGCHDCTVENLTITGGERDTSGNATDAAIVIKNSLVTVRNNRIIRNIGDSAMVARCIVGIMGVAGRENSRITIAGNEIIGNSWDGVALYRGAEALIENNIIDGVDKATGQRIGGGRGVGIGVTWNAKATIRGNLVKRYWKGIGLFVDAQGVVENNIVEDIVTWGISLWDADKGKPVGKIRNNVIYNTGACGASITRSSEEGDPGYFQGNIIVKTAQNPKYDSPDYYCYQCALALHAVPKYFVIDENYFYNNRRATADLPDYDISRQDFKKALETRCSELLHDPLFQQTDFVQEFCEKQ